MRISRECDALENLKKLQILISNHINFFISNNHSKYQSPPLIYIKIYWKRESVYKQANTNLFLINTLRDITDISLSNWIRVKASKLEQISFGFYHKKKQEEHN